MRNPAEHFSLAYLDAEEAVPYLKGKADRILGVVGFGRPCTLGKGASPLWVDIPVLGGESASIEVWTSRLPVTRCDWHGITGASDGNVLFGSLALEQRPGEAMETLAQQAYGRVFDFLDHEAYPHLLRVWHYFPHINDAEDGLERYRGFNAGRHAAFIAGGRPIREENIPAASVLGSCGGPLVIYFIAAKHPGRAVENPRQVSAYHYPKIFGPRSPIFVRAVSASLGGHDCFFISGTASIVGYETVHQGDAEKQASETLLNIRTLLMQMPGYDPLRGRVLLKVYLRNSADLQMVRSKVLAEFGEGCEATYLHSSICRSDLLLEIEGAYFASSN